MLCYWLTQPHVTVPPWSSQLRDLTVSSALVNASTLLADGEMYANIGAFMSVTT